MNNRDEKQHTRVDKFLWQARFFKSRSRSAGVVLSGHLRINGVRVRKPAHSVKVSDVLTFPQGRNVRVIEICQIPHRRGPATEAVTLFLDHSPIEKDQNNIPTQPAVPRTSRPTKKQRRDIGFFKRNHLE